MSINTNKAKVTRDFMWSKELEDVEDGDPQEIVYSIKHHHTPEFGSTISVSTDGGKDYYAYPADMFAEVVDFLRSERAIAPAASEQCSSGEKAAPKPQKKTLPLPVVQSSEENEGRNFAVPFEVSGNPVESFGDDSSEVEEPIEERPVVRKKIGRKLETEVDPQQARLERLAAAKRAAEAKGKHSIKRDETQVINEEEAEEVEVEEKTE